MPDLDLVKQGKQGRGTGAGGFRRAGRARPRGRRDHVNRDEGGSWMRDRPGAGKGGTWCAPTM